MQASLSTHSSDHPLLVISQSFLTSSLTAERWEGSPARHEAGCQPGLRTIPVAQLPPCLFYLQQAALSWFRVLTWRQVMCTWLTDVPRLAGNCGLQNICKTLCSCWGSSRSPAALEQPGAHQGTSGLGSEEALPAPGGELWPPSGHACRQLKGMTVLKAFLIIPHNTVIP